MMCVSDNGTELTSGAILRTSVSLNPGVSFTQLLPNVMKIFGVFPGTKTVNSVTVAQTFSLGFGGTLSSEALRTDKFNTYYSVKDLMRPESAICQSNGKPDPEEDPYTYLNWTPAKSSPLLIESNLGIKDWLIGAMYFDIALPSSLQPSPPSSASNSGGKFEGKFEGKLEGPFEGQAKGTFEGKTSSGGSSSGGSGFWPVPGSVDTRLS
jgi:hypothetical protein